MNRYSIGLLVSAVCIGLTATPALVSAQTTSSSLTGVVADSGGGVLPGVTVVLKNTDTGTVYQAVTNETGAYSLPALPAGTYTVTFSLEGFKSVSISGVKLVTATAATLPRVSLEIGRLSETVTVTGGANLVNTTSSAVTSTISSTEIQTMPLVSRNALYFATLLPGVDTAASPRNSTVNGLPSSVINVTIDGVNVQDNYSKSGDGFFAAVRPLLDAVEEVTVTGATPGANSAGQGGVQVSFTTKSGTNRFAGTVYDYLRDPRFNTNYYFNTVAGLPKNNVVLKQAGIALGGPIVLPGLFDGHNRAFVFFNFEEFRLPASATRTRTVATPEAAAGIFRYQTATGVQSVNLLALAAQNGQLATPNPAVAGLLGAITAATRTTGTLQANADPNSASYIYQAEQIRSEHNPTTRVDFNLSSKHRLSGTYYLQRTIFNPDLLTGSEARFPGFPGAATQHAWRNQASSRLRSVLSSRLVNDLGWGLQTSPTFMRTNLTAADFSNQNGYALSFPIYTSPFTSNTTTYRNPPTWNIDNAVNWLRGKHSVQLGGGFTRVNVTLENTSLVPGITLGLSGTDNDPANAMFTNTGGAANFPGASTANLNDARNLYGLLTGRVQAITANLGLDEKTGKYSYLGPTAQRGRMDAIGLFAQDSWRVTQQLTLNAGLRWDVQLPFTPSNSVLALATFADLCGTSGQGTGFAGRGCNLFSPGATGGIKPTFTQFKAGTTAYKTDWNNAAPNVGLAWRPNVQGGVLRTLLGDPEQATLRGGYSVAYTRYGMSDFLGVFGANPGVTVSATRNLNNGNLGPAPLLLSQTSLLGAPTQVAGQSLPSEAIYPISASAANSLNIFDPNLQTSFSRSFTFGLQRTLGKTTALEVMYVGTRNVGQWVTENWNGDLNVQENGFLAEFQKAQANLRANLTAGRGASFAYFGSGSGTSPLPIYLAYLSGGTAAQASDPASYAGAAATNFTNATFVGRLSQYSPGLAAAASDLQGNTARRANALAAGLPPNFFVLNPDVSAANITRNGGLSQYDSLQVQLRRRFSKGLLFNTNYTYGVRNTSALATLRDERILVRDTAGVPQALKLDASYEIPVGRGRHFASNASPWLDPIIGGWQISGTARLQSGRQLSLTGVQLVGMTPKELSSIFRARKDAATGYFYYLPQDVIDNTIKAFSTNAATASGYGSLGAPTGRYIAPEGGPSCVPVIPGQCSGYRSVFVTGPTFKRVDLNFRKSVGLVGRSKLQVQMDLLNAFNAVNLIPVLTTGVTTDSYLGKTGYTDANNTFDPGGRLGQLMLRVTW